MEEIPPIVGSLHLQPESRLRKIAIQDPSMREQVADVFLQRFPRLRNRALLLLDDRDLLQMGWDHPDLSEEVVNILLAAYRRICVAAALNHNHWPRQKSYQDYADQGAIAAVQYLVHRRPEHGRHPSMAGYLVSLAPKRAVDAYRVDHPKGPKGGFISLDGHWDGEEEYRGGGQVTAPLITPAVEMDAWKTAVRQAVDDLGVQSVRHNSQYAAIIERLFQAFIDGEEVPKASIARDLEVSPAAVSHALAKFRRLLLKRLRETGADIPQFVLGHDKDDEES